jgi:hypothetical protein
MRCASFETSWSWMRSSSRGMGLIIPGFVPGTLRERVEYVPTVTD